MSIVMVESVKNLYELMTVMGAVRAPGASQPLDRCLRVPTSFRHGSHSVPSAGRARARNGPAPGRA
jgi:hypothetical protein